jgi:CBS domain-containing protein
MKLDTEKLNFIASPDDTIEEAWSKIEENFHRSLIIVDNNKVVGTLSDGDLRKTILAKRLLLTPVKEVMNVNFVYVRESQRNKAKKILIEKDIFLLPVVDDEMNLIDIIIKK